MEKVYILNIPKYDPALITQGLKKAAAELNVSLKHKSAILLADCPWAHPKYAPDAHTHVSLIQGVAQALEPADITIAANSLTDIPTRYSFRHAGYDGLASHLKAKLIPLDEAATRKVVVENGKVLTSGKMPAAWLNSAFRVAMPKLRQSTLVPFAGVLRQMQTLLTQREQLKDCHRLPEKMADLVSAVPLDLIVVDAIQVLHKGGELSGQLHDLGVVIAGTNALAVDMVCAVALGLDPAKVDFLQEARERNLAPRSLDEIQVVGEVSLDGLRKRSAAVELSDPNPANFALPSQVKVMRSVKARQAGAAGILADVLCILRNASVSWKPAPRTTIVIGAVEQIPPGIDEYSTIIFMDDTSRGEFTGYGRIVRLPGRNISLIQVLNDVPYAMKIFNMRAELGMEFMTTKLIASVRRLFPQV
jgi:uncharacterized protein (DUF362 family)